MSALLAAIMQGRVVKTKADMACYLKGYKMPIVVLAVEDAQTILDIARAQDSQLRTSQPGMTAEVLSQNEENRSGKSGQHEEGL